VPDTAPGITFLDLLGHVFEEQLLPLVVGLDGVHCGLNARFLEVLLDVLLDNVQVRVVAILVFLLVFGHEGTLRKELVGT
jgi:hypothetical protein